MHLRIASLLATGFWGTAFFAVAFSLRLIYLEPLVIKAACTWCLASAVIVVLLLLPGTPSIAGQFTFPDKDELCPGFCLPA